MRPAAPRRVLMTADTVGGVWTYALDLTRALRHRGVEVFLATMGAKASPQQQKAAQAAGAAGLAESTLRLPWMEQPWQDVEVAGDWLLDIAERVQPDVIHLNEPVFGKLDWPAPTVAVVHSCVLSWWENVRNAPAPAEWNRYREEMRHGLLETDEVVAPSTWMLDTVRRLYEVRGGRVIPNGRDPDMFTPEAKQPFVFAAGRLWDQAKNLGALDRVAKGLEWPVYVAGESQHPAGGEHPRFKHCRTLGPLPAEDVAAWLRRASIYAFPAKYEPFGLSVLEAALAGCTLVLSDLATLRELWDGAAVFVSPDEQPTLRLAIRSLIEDSGLRNALAMRARRRAAELTPERMARAYLEVYTGLLAGGHRRAKEPACAS